MKLTAQDIHAAFVAAAQEEGKPPLVSSLGDWDCLTERTRVLYTKMAEHLNTMQSQGQEEKA